MPQTGLFGLAAIVCAVVAAAIIIGYLVGRPALTAGTKLWLLLGLGVFPLGAAFTTTVAGMQATTKASFCGSCHTMTPFLAEAMNPKSKNIAAVHARIPRFGPEACETCHGAGGELGFFKDKYDGLHHVYAYITEFRHKKTAPEGGEPLKYKGEFPNSACTQCHSTYGTSWLAVQNHQDMLDDVRSGKTSCVDSSCHGPAHPAANKQKKIKEAGK